MNWLDIAIIVLIAVPTLIGLRTGIIKAVMSLAGVIVGVILAGKYHVALAEQLTFITEDNIASIVAFALILLGVMIIASMLAALIKFAVSVVMWRQAEMRIPFSGFSAKNLSLISFTTGISR